MIYGNVHSDPSFFLLAQRSWFALLKQLSLLEPVLSESLDLLTQGPIKNHGNLHLPAWIPKD